MGRTRFFSHIPYQRLVRRLQKPETAQEKSLAPRVFSNRFGEHTDDNGDHLRCGDHFRSGIICGNVHLKTELFPIPRTLIPYETDFCSLWLSLFFLSCIYFLASFISLLFKHIKLRPISYHQIIFYFQLSYTQVRVLSVSVHIRAFNTLSCQRSRSVIVLLRPRSFFLSHLNLIIPVNQLRLITKATICIRKQNHDKFWPLQ